LAFIRKKGCWELNCVTKKKSEDEFEPKEQKPTKGNK